RAGAGVTVGRGCGWRVKRDTRESIADAVMSLPEGTRFYVLFPASAGAVVGENGDPVEAVPAKPKKTRVKRPAAGSINVKAHLMSLMGRGLTRLYDAAKNEIIELQTPGSYHRNDFVKPYVL